MIRNTLLALAFIMSFNTNAQYGKPVDIPIYLSANFGELRNNHFHSGLDIKTQGVTGKAVYSIADGYVSRIFVSPSGYGKAIYITHPATGQISVYGHLNGFNAKIAEYVKTQQYKNESFSSNLLPEKGEFTVKKGELIAYSGNSGSSGGPHVHFEIRDEKTENIIDPLPYYKQEISDKVSPEVRGIAIYPVSGKGVVNSGSNPLRLNVSKNKKGEYLAPTTTAYAWGSIGLGIKAYDRMTGTANTYGVKNIQLYVDGNLILKSVIDSYHFDQTRMLNSFIDFADWRNNNSFFMKSFVEPGNTLHFYQSAVNNGYVNINEERIYEFRYELSDVNGNTTNYSFSVTGKKQTIPPAKKGMAFMTWNEDNRYSTDAFTLFIAKGNLYTDMPFTLTQSTSKTHFSDRFRVNDTPVPFQKNAEIKIKLAIDPLKNKNEYGIVLLKGNRESWVGGTYENGQITTTIRETGGEYAVSSDNVPPTITPVQEAKWSSLSKIMLRIGDDKSGVSKIRGTIDGRFALFENDVKSPIYTYFFDSSRLEKGKNHKLEFTATDACGNTTNYSSEFYY